MFKLIFVCLLHVLLMSVCLLSRDFEGCRDNVFFISGAICGHTFVPNLVTRLGMILTLLTLKIFFELARIGCRQILTWRSPWYQWTLPFGMVYYLGCNVTICWQYDKAMGWGWVWQKHSRNASDSVLLFLLQYIGKITNNKICYKGKSILVFPIELLLPFYVFIIWRVI